jgi:hypothetical protein
LPVETAKATLAAIVSRVIGFILGSSPHLRRSLSARRSFAVPAAFSPGPSIIGRETRRWRAARQYARHPGFGFALLFPA